MIFIWFFQYLFNDQIIELMNCESNKYSVHQNPAKPLKFTNSELEQFSGILFTMSVAKMPVSEAIVTSLLNIWKVPFLFLLPITLRLKSLENSLGIYFLFYKVMKKFKGFFSPPAFVSYRSARKIKDYIVRSKLHPVERKVGCRGARCQVLLTNLLAS